MKLLYTQYEATQMELALPPMKLLLLSVGKVDFNTPQYLLVAEYWKEHEFVTVKRQDATI